MKRLLIITDLFPDKYSPHSEVFVQHQAIELAKIYDVRVIATRFKHKRAVEDDFQNKYQVTYVYLPFVKHVYISLIVFYELVAIPLIKKVINDWNPDLIHVHDYKHMPELFLLHLHLKQYQIPKFLTAHNIRTHPMMVKSSFFKWFYKICFKYSYSGWSHIFTVNDKIKDIISKDSKITAISNIGNAINPVPVIDPQLLEKYKKQLLASNYKIISVGNLKEEKGFSLLIQAVSILKKLDNHIHVFIVGKGDNKAKLIKEIEILGLSDSITFTGDLKNEIVRNMYPLFDAFVLPSYCETFGIVYIEAMYAGIPVVGVKGQGIDGVIKNGVNGLLAKPKDATGLADQIEYLMKNADLAKAMALKGQNLVQDEFMLPSLIKKIVSIYEQ